LIAGALPVIGIICMNVYNTKLLLKQVDPEQVHIEENESPVPIEEIHFDVEGQNVNITEN
jgi:hypothetical protein